MDMFANKPRLSASPDGAEGGAAAGTERHSNNLNSLMDSIGEGFAGWDRSGSANLKAILGYAFHQTAVAHPSPFVTALGEAFRALIDHPNKAEGFPPTMNRETWEVAWKAARNMLSVTAQLPEDVATASMRDRFIEVLQLCLSQMYLSDRFVGPPPFAKLITSKNCKEGDALFALDQGKDAWGILRDELTRGGSIHDALTASRQRLVRINEASPLTTAQNELLLSFTQLSDNQELRGLSLKPDTATGAIDSFQKALVIPCSGNKMRAQENDYPYKLGISPEQLQRVLVVFLHRASNLEQRVAAHSSRELEQELFLGALESVVEVLLTGPVPQPFKDAVGKIFAQER